MPRQPLAHVGAGRSERSTRFEAARAWLFDVDVDRRKRIDAAIDYFGAGSLRLARDPLLDTAAAPAGIAVLATSIYLHRVLAPRSLRIHAARG
jgi:hypothetical protein